MKFRRLIALLMAFAVIAAACGGSSGTDDTSTGDAGSESGSSDGTDAATQTSVENQIEIENITNDDASGTGEVVVGEEPLADRGPEPSGTLDYSWHSAFAQSWFLPSKNTATVSQFGTQYILHDAMLKSMPGKPFWPSMAESYSVAEDFTSATFTLREGLLFHNGDPVTTDDVEFSYLNYAGANGNVLQDNLDSIDKVDERTITFNFNKPFLDFLLLYGTTATGAGWIIPKAYFEEVGEEGFLEVPIGAGPFKFVENQANAKIVYEANTDWWYKNPGVQTLNFHAITDPATRFAAVSTGELDLASVISADLLDAIKADPNVELVPTTAVPFWIEFMGMNDPESPFNDIRVREAVELVLDREEINETETGGGGETVGQWIPRQWDGALQIESNEYDVERAEELMAEAGYADGFSIPSLTPFPNYFSLGERVIQALALIDIKAEMTQLERGEFVAQQNSGTDANFERDTILLHVSGAGGDAAARIRTFAISSGSASRINDPKIDADFEKYEASIDAAERKELLDGIQQHIIDQHYYPYIYTLGLNMIQGPDVVTPSSEVWAQIPQYVYPGPYENIRVKDE